MKLYKAPTTCDEADANLKEWNEEYKRAEKAVAEAEAVVKQRRTALDNAAASRRYAEDDQATLANSPFASRPEAHEATRQAAEKIWSSGRAR